MATGLDRIIGELQARGMYAEVEVFNYYTDGGGPFADRSVWTTTRQDLWATYVISRLAASRAVFLWTVCGFRKF